MKTIAFASVAHEFRNPLNGIITSLNLLEGKINLETCGTNYNVAKNCSKLMLFLVNDIMDYA
jgi:signal transduction histidine kinase